ncbi:MAG: hypothetical protein Q8K82_11375 [Gemmatimonadaceae bacterium]|nr:hypothetical protein [Gemmatimonadaceae bacterium]
MSSIGDTVTFRLARHTKAFARQFSELFLPLRVIACTSSNSSMLPQILAVGVSSHWRYTGCTPFANPALLTLFDFQRRFRD